MSKLTKEKIQEHNCITWYATQRGSTITLTRSSRWCGSLSFIRISSELADDTTISADAAADLINAADEAMEGLIDNAGGRNASARRMMTEAPVWGWRITGVGSHI